MLYLKTCRVTLEFSSAEQSPWFYDFQLLTEHHVHSSFEGQSSNCCLLLSHFHIHKKLSPFAGDKNKRCGQNSDFSGSISMEAAPYTYHQQCRLGIHSQFRANRINISSDPFLRRSMNLANADGKMSHNF